MRRHKPVLILTLILLAFSTAGGIFCFKVLRFPDYTSSVYSESAEALKNPYIGWYQIYTYSLSDASFSSSDIPEKEFGPGLAMLQFNLKYYVQTPISDAGLQYLDAVLGAWQSTGRQLILRFLYDWDGAALEKEPENLSLILEHMSQTAEVVNRYTDCVYILQGIFVGNWGEMHGSNYMGKEDMLTLVNHLAEVTDPSIFLAVRTPEQWRTITDSSQPLSEEQAFDGSLPARLSLFNDGMLGSVTDLGTYGDPGADFSPSGFEKRSRQAELLFQNELCRYVPNGGEAVIANPYNDFPSAIQDLSCIHASYLNSDYDRAVLSKWQATTCEEEGIFYGMNGYDYISRHLGYRYVVRSSALTFEAPWDKEALLSIVLENVGFSNSYTSFDVFLILKNVDTGYTTTVPVQTNTRFWDTELPVSLEIPLEIRTLPEGTYDIFLNVYDPASGFHISLANAGAEDGDGCYVGSLILRKFLR